VGDHKTDIYNKLFRVNNLLVPPTQTGSR